MLDVGANVECDADQLVDFAVMGEAFARAVLGLERPTVGLLNVGSEDVKGNDAVNGAAHILRNVSLPMEFMGLCRRRRHRRGHGRRGGDRRIHRQYRAQDGGRHGQAGHQLSAQRAQAFRCLGVLGAFLASGALNALRRKLDPRASNGGMFLGLNGVVVKSHGGTDALGFASATDMAIDMAEGRHQQ